MLRLDWLVRSHRRVSVGASRGPDLGRDSKKVRIKVGCSLDWIGITGFKDSY